MSRDVTVGNFALRKSKRLCIVSLLEVGKDGEVDLGFSTSWRAVHLDSLLFFLYLRNFPYQPGLKAWNQLDTVLEYSLTHYAFILFHDTFQIFGDFLYTIIIAVKHMRLSFRKTACREHTNGHQFR